MFEWLYELVNISAYMRLYEIEDDLRICGQQELIDLRVVVEHGITKLELEDVTRVSKLARRKG